MLRPGGHLDAFFEAAAVQKGLDAALEKFPTVLHLSYETLQGNQGERRYKIREATHEVV